MIVLAGSPLASDSGLSLLKNEQSARPTGLGGAGVALAGDPSFLPYNPAAATGLDKFTASFGHTTFWENVRFESGFFGTRLWPKIYLHGHLRFATVDNIEQRHTASSEPEAYFANSDLMGKIGLTYQVTDRLAAGFGVGWAFEKIEAWRGSKMNLDLGVIGRVYDSLSLGASVTGIGGDMTLLKDGAVASDRIPLPTTWRFGGSYHYDRYLGVADVVTLDEETHFHFGAEAQIHEYFSLRAGYMTGWDSKHFSAGASFGMRNIRVDYAFLPFSNNLGTSHLFNLTFSL